MHNRVWRSWEWGGEGAGKGRKPKSEQEGILQDVGKAGGRPSPIPSHAPLLTAVWLWAS